MAFQKKRKGVVILSKIDPEARSGFGFIQPAGSDGSRENNVWFGFGGVWKYASGIAVGDVVEYVLNERAMSATAAKCVWIKERAKDHVDKPLSETTTRPARPSSCSGSLHRADADQDATH
jgi:hypothetical protein